MPEHLVALAQLYYLFYFARVFATRAFLFVTIFLYIALCHFAKTLFCLIEILGRLWLFFVCVFVLLPLTGGFLGANYPLAGKGVSARYPLAGK